MSGIFLTLAGVSAASVPGAPTIGTATATGTSTATVAFTAPVSDGGSTIISYTATSSPSSITGTLVQSGSGTITVTGLASGTSYTFTVTATNAIGTGPASAASNSITTQTSQLIFTWGKNNSGQVGDGTTTYRSSPVQIGSSIWSILPTQTYQHTAAITGSGYLWFWGLNDRGQLGVGNTTNYSSPKQVGSSAGWAAIGGGVNAESSAAIKTDGTLWVWGTNGSGQLGLGSTSFANSSPIVRDAGWAMMTFGSGMSIGIKTNGTMWTCGANAGGRLGLNNTTYYSSPKQVGGLSTWVTARAGQAIAFAIKNDNTMWAWGRNNNGQLGLGYTTGGTGYISSPVQALSGGVWSKVAALNGSGGLGLKTNGTLWAWGYNSGYRAGQLGLNNSTNYSSPVQIPGSWAKLASHYGGGVAIKTSGELFTWGKNNFGQLGVGNTTDYSSPKQVGGLATWLEVCGARSGCFALRNP